ncbi:MAG: LamG domain-containing protein [Planctomycetota bacterium]
MLLALALAACSGSGADSSASTLGGTAALSIPDNSGVAIEATQGGPFSEVTRQVRLVNRGTQTTAWSAVVGQPWISLSERAGSLAGGQATSVRLTLDPSYANNLAAGRHYGQVVFRGEDGMELTTDVRLDLDAEETIAEGALSVSGANGIRLEAVVGRPVAAVDFELSNEGADSLGWRVDTGADWLQLPETVAGALVGGETSSLSLDVNEERLAQLGPGEYEATVTLQYTVGSVESTLQRQVGVSVGPNTSSAASGGRATRGLLALYDFEEAFGDTIFDSGGVGAPLNLRVADPSKTTWIPGGLRLDSATIVESMGSAGKINDALRSSGELTFELWIEPSSLDQEGPARVMSLSDGAYSRNLTIGQGLWNGQPNDTYSARLRTQTTDLNGDPMLIAPSGVARAELQHVVFTFSTDGTGSLFVDGSMVASHNPGPNLGSWDAGFKLAFGNEIGTDRAWLGSLHLAAVYDRALSRGEVTGNYVAGPQDPAAGRISVSPLEDFEVSFVEGEDPPVDQKIYRVENIGDAVVGWEANPSAGWIYAIGRRAGRLDPGEFADVVVRLDVPTVRDFDIGRTTATVDFINVAEPFGTTQREVGVTVFPEGSNGGGGKPGPGNTGPTNPGILQPISGFDVFEDGAVIENVAISGPIRIYADNVTIRNFRLDGNGSAFGIYSRDGGVNLVIEDGEIVDCDAAAIAGRHWTARRINMHELGSDGVKCDGNNVLEGCWIHRLGVNPGAHADGNQTRGGGNCEDIVIRGNNFDMPIPDGPNGPGPPYASNATLFISTAVGEINNLIIDGNWLNGGNFTVYLRDKGRGYGYPQNVVMTNNRFGRDYRHGVLVNDTQGTAVITGNRWDDTNELMSINN